MADNVGSSLPWDVLLEIFLRLPIKTLVRFRCVSKECWVLMSDPYFRYLLRHRSDKNPLFLLLHASNDGFNSTCKISLMDNAGAMHSQFTFHIPTPRKSFFFSYSYHHLICISNETQFYVCNPTTREFLSLPYSPHSFCSSFLNFGIGSLPSSNHCKIVNIFPSRDDLNLTKAEVFTITDGEPVGNGCWKLIGNCPCVPVHSGLCVNGAIYWVILDPTYPMKSKKILYWGLEDEKFGFISCPDVYEGVGYFHQYLVELKGFLCLGRHGEGRMLQLWRLKDRRNGSWVKAYNIDLRPHCLDGVVCGYAPSDENENGELLICSGRESYWSCNGRNELRVETNLNEQRPSRLYIHPHSLFSLHS